jgi:hypothetical protein
MTFVLKCASIIVRLFKRKASRMRYLALLVLVIALAASAVFAQSEAEPPVCEGAQEYYDTVDADNVVMLSTSAAISGNRVSARLRAVETIREFATSLVEGEHPDCIAVAVQWYADGINALANGLELLVDGQTTDFAIRLAKSSQLIGQWRGYMAAVGVEIVPDGENTQYR